MIIEANSIRMVRTEEGKRLRKMYENHELHHGFNEHREMEMRTDGVANTLSTVQKDNYVCEKSIVAMRGRNSDNPHDGTLIPTTEQRLEPNKKGLCNTLTSVQKDNLVLESPIIFDDYNSVVRADQSTIGAITTNIGKDAFRNGTKLIECWRIRKLTPKECWRLMDFKDEDFHRAEEANSNTQLYKQAGNSIVKNVLVAIMGQLIPGKEEVYIDRMKGA